ncbi:AmmeMemoRadiSam system radical SAM enzyme [bacterium]|nr:AmmeMemoRadiSam system radical SAM enzyme [bacterium]
MKEALFYECLENKKVKCRLCFHECKIDENKEGLCIARRNIAGKLIASTYGELVAANLDPIEKKPLYHFHPGEEILSVAANGCNLDCPFCQNADISRGKTSSRYVPPEKLIEIASERRSKGIAYTYTEPLIWFEYLLDSSRIAHEQGLYNVIVSNGTINEKPLTELLPYIDAANIDIKGDNEFYRKVLKGDMNSTLRTIRTLYRAGVHTEVTLLLVPGGNDSVEQINEVISFIESLDLRIPFHISRYFPHNQYPAPPTPEETMLRAYGQTKGRLLYAYLGNIAFEHDNNTYCPSCGALLIERAGYSVNIIGVEEGRCSSCKRKADVVV